MSVFQNQGDKVVFILVHILTLMSVSKKTMEVGRLGSNPNPKWHDYQGINQPPHPTALVGNNIEVEYLSNHNSDLIQIWKVGLGDQA